MNKSSVSIALLALFTLTGTASAADWYVGETGQYHTLPYSQDVQKITLVAMNTGPCTTTFGAQTLYAIDEFGVRETIPFNVPSKTVFLLTDGIFEGATLLNVGTSRPWLNIFQTNQSHSFEKASFLAADRLKGVPSEEFSGQGSIVSGAAFAANSTLCAVLGFGAESSGVTGYNMVLTSAVVHGTLIDDVRTNSYPYLSW